MAKAGSIRIYHDDDALAIIDKFNAVLKMMNIKIIDTTDPDGETVDIYVTDAPPEPDDKLWGK